MNERANRMNVIENELENMTVNLEAVGWDHDYSRLSETTKAKMEALSAEYKRLSYILLFTEDQPEWVEYK